MPPECHQRECSMKKKMTDAFIRSIPKNPANRLEISDTEKIGLRFRMSSKGNASWIYQKKIKGGKRRGFKLGTYPALSLAEARLAAHKFQIDAEQGIDPIEADKEAKAYEEAEKLAKKSVKHILDLYVSAHINSELKPGQSRNERKRQLEVYLKPYFSTYISDLSRSELQSIIDTKKAEGKTIMGNRLHAALRAFTGWAHKRGHMENDIGILLQRAGKERSRERTPSLDEVRAIWSASFKMGDLWGPYFRLCILTGQRCRSDVLQMQWSWIDFNRFCYEIPNPKNNRAHVVHLSSPAIDELAKLKKLQIRSPFVFTTTGDRAASGVSRAKLLLDKYIFDEWRGPTFQSWVLHDLRRSQATALAEAGFDEGVVDRIQNHVASGSRASVVAAVYNKAQKLHERAKALDAWARMVTGNASKVVSLKVGAKF